METISSVSASRVSHRAKPGKMVSSWLRLLMTLVLVVLISSGIPLEGAATIALAGSEADDGPGDPPDAQDMAASPGQLIISEFRLRGPNGANDEFIEIYNNSGADHVVSSVVGSAGYGVFASDGALRFTIPNGTVIPKNGHFLGVNSVGYSLASYPSGNGSTASGNATYTTDIPDNAGIALFTTTVPVNATLANRLDAVGSTSEAKTLYKEGAGYPALVNFSIDYSWYRDLISGLPKDTNNNAGDFLFVDTNGTSAGGGQRLGAPGPENLTSPPVQTSNTAGLAIAPIDPNVSLTAPPNLVYNFTSDPANNSTYGTMSIRRKITNNSGSPITRLRFRVSDITTFPSPSGISDLRPRTSTNIIVTVSGPTNITVHGTTLEQPPTQQNGGGFNSTLSVNAITLATPLANGASIYVQFLFGRQVQGCERVRLDNLISFNTCGAKISTSTFTCDSFSAIGNALPASGYIGMVVWNITNDTSLVDSFSNNARPAVYAPINGDSSYTITGSFPRVPYGTQLSATIYRAPSAAYGSWDLQNVQVENFTCNEARIHLPVITR